MGIRWTILVIDPEPALARDLTGVFWESEPQIVHVSGAREALRQLWLEEFQFVVLRSGQHEMEFLHNLREMDRFRRLPVLVVGGTTSTRQRRLDAICKMGAVDYLLPPVDVNRIARILETTCHYLQKTGRWAAAAGGMPEPAQHQDTLPSDSHNLFGRLHDVTFVDLFGRLAREKANGVLHVRHERTKKAVYLDGGEAVFVKSNLLHECLGQVLVRTRVITPEECEESLRQMKDSGRQLGAMLIAMGCITSADLDCALRLQLREKLTELFGWQDGEYHFRKERPQPPATVHLGCTATAIILDGVRKNYSLERLQTLLDPHMDELVIPLVDFESRCNDLILDGNESTIVRQIRASCTMRELLFGSTNLLQTYQLLYTLKCAGIVAFGQSARPRSLAPTSPHILT